MKKVTLYYNPARNVWTHDASNKCFVHWEAKDSVETREHVEDAIRSAMADYFSGLPGHPVLTASDIDLYLANAPERHPPPPVEVQLTNFAAARPALAPDADAAATTAYTPKALKPTGRLLA